MAVPSVITDLNVVAASNSPAGADTVASNTGPDEYFRALSAIIKREQSQGTATASAATIDLGAITTGSYLHITGTTGPITSFGTVAAGVERILVFDSTPTITHNATSMILLGGASRTLAAGDVSVFRSEGSGNWREVAYQPANGSGGMFLQSGTGAVVRTAQDKMRERISVFDFMTAAQIADVKAGTAAIDVTVPIQAAIDAAGAGGGVYFPVGTYYTSATINLKEAQVIVGESSGNDVSSGACIYIKTGAFAAFTVPPSTFMGAIRDIQIKGSSPFTAGSIGVSFGDTRNTTTFLLENLYLYRLETCVKAFDDGLAVQDQISQVTVKNCMMVEVGYGIYLSSQNADGWMVDTCSASFSYAFFYGHRTGYTYFVNCTGYGYAPGAAFFYFPSVGAALGPVTAMSCQCEGTDYFILKKVDDFTKISLYNCLVNAPIEYEAQGVLMMQGCEISAAVKFNTVSPGNSWLYDISNRWDDNAYPLAVPTFNSNSAYPLEFGTYYTSDANSQDRVAINRGAVNMTVFPTFGASVAIEPNKGDFINVVADTGGAFTVANPTLKGVAWPSYALTGGAEVTIRIKNTSGGALGAITWDTKYKMTAFTSPASGFSRSITFKFDGTNWIEVNRSAADVPN